jgi:hypothetical protein
MLHRKYKRKDFLNDRLIEEFVVYFNNGKSLDNFLAEMNNKKLIDERFLESILGILNIWKTNKYNSFVVNNIRLDLFKKLIEFKKTDIPGKGNMIPAGASPIFYDTLDKLIEIDISSNLETIENMIKILSQKNLAYKIIFESIEIDNFIDLMGVSKYFFSEIAHNNKMFFYIMRILLGLYKFETISNFNQISIDNKYYSDSEIFSGIQSMLRLKKDVKKIDSKQINFLQNYCELYSHVPESIKLKKKLINLKRKIGD